MGTNISNFHQGKNPAFQVFGISVVKSCNAFLILIFHDIQQWCHISKRKKLDGNPDWEMSSILLIMVNHKWYLCLSVTFLPETVDDTWMNIGAIFLILWNKVLWINITFRAILQSQVIGNLSSQLDFYLLDSMKNKTSKGTVKRIQLIYVINADSFLINLRVFFSF